ncbi:MAG: hypothetical protein AAF372_05305 [Pseudomonadota bacterium]
MSGGYRVCTLARGFSSRITINVGLMSHRAKKNISLWLFDYRHVELEIL